MRKEPMPPPLIRVMPEEEFYKILDKVDYLDDSVLAMHYRDSDDSDVIAFCQLKGYTEEACISILLHEIDHWAQEMYLTSEENNVRASEYAKIANDDKIPFCEYALAFSGGYSYKDWEKKYGKKNTPIVSDMSNFYTWQQNSFLMDALKNADKLMEINGVKL